MKSLGTDYRLELQKFIVSRSNAHIVECQCSACQNMCKTTPCIGTPYDMVAIQEHEEYQNKILVTINAAGLPIGIPPTYMLAPKFDAQKGCCAFFEEGKCVLHEKGLKPLEGKLASCKNGNEITTAYKLIFESWKHFQVSLKTLYNSL